MVCHVVDLTIKTDTSSRYSGLWLYHPEYTHHSRAHALSVCAQVHDYTILNTPTSAESMVHTLSVCTWIHSYTTLNTPISAEPKLPSPHNAVTKQKEHLPLFFFLKSSLSQVITSCYNISTIFTYYRNSVFYWAAQNTLELEDRRQYYQD